MSLLGTYYLFTPLTTRKIKILKKWKRYLEILSIDKLTQVYQKIVAATPQKNPKVSKNEKWKKLLEISSFYIVLHMCIKNYGHMIYGSWHPETWCATGGRKDGWIVKATYRVGCPIWKVSTRLLSYGIKLACKF